MSPRTRRARHAAPLLLVLALAGCAGSLGSVLDGLPGTDGTVTGEIRGVDERRREIHLGTTWGQRETVEYDRYTQVVYRQDRYPVRALERGDRVSVRVQRTRHGRLYADRVYVERSVREARGRYPDDRRDRYPDDLRGRTARLDGRVTRIDHRGGWFELRDGDRGVYTVTLPYRPSSGVVKRFDRLRRGDRVRVEVTLIDRRRTELRRFR